MTYGQKWVLIALYVFSLAFLGKFVYDKHNAPERTPERCAVSIDFVNDLLGYKELFFYNCQEDK